MLLLPVFEALWLWLSRLPWSTRLLGTCVRVV